MADQPSSKPRSRAVGFVLAAAFLAFVGTLVLKHHDFAWFNTPVDNVVTGTVR